MFSNYPTSAIVIIALLSTLCLVLAFFVWKYYKKYDYFLDEYIEQGNLAERRRKEILDLKEEK